MLDVKMTHDAQHPPFPLEIEITDTRTNEVVRQVTYTFPQGVPPWAEVQALLRDNVAAVTLPPEPEPEEPTVTWSAADAVEIEEEEPVEVLRPWLEVDDDYSSEAT